MVGVRKLICIFDPYNGVEDRRHLRKTQIIFGFSFDLDKFFTFKNDNIFSFCSLNQNFALSLQTNNINRVENVAGVSASDDDLQIFGGSTGNAASLLAVTLCRCENTNQTNLQEFKVTQISQITQKTCGSWQLVVQGSV